MGFNFLITLAVVAFVFHLHRRAIQGIALFHVAEDLKADEKGVVYVHVPPKMLNEESATKLKIFLLPWSEEGLGAWMGQLINSGLFTSVCLLPACLGESDGAVRVFSLAISVTCLAASAWVHYTLSASAKRLFPKKKIVIVTAKEK